MMTASLDRLARDDASASCLERRAARGSTASSGVNVWPASSTVQSLPMCRLNRQAQRSGCMTCSSLAARPTSSLPSVDADDRRRERLAQGVGDEPGTVGRHVGRDGIGRAKIDADDRAGRCLSRPPPDPLLLQAAIVFIVAGRKERYK